MSELAAKRWAKALMELAQENENISKEEILDDLKEVVENIETSEQLKEVIKNPAISADEKQIVICKLFQNKVMPIVYNFLFVLNLRKRMDILDEIAVEFEKELERIKNIVRVDITSAIDLNDDKKSYVKCRIEEKLKKNVRVNWATDTNIIGGLIFNIDDTVVDNSIKHKLESLSKNITKL